jgi:hypothetical protein
MLALHNSQRPLASDIAAEVLVVDLDTDRVEIRNPHPHALSKVRPFQRLCVQVETIAHREA